MKGYTSEINTIAKFHGVHRIVRYTTQISDTNSSNKTKMYLSITISSRKIKNCS